MMPVHNHSASTGIDFLSVLFLSGPVKEDEEVVDSNIMPYCSLDKQQKKTIGEMEQEFLQALQVNHAFRCLFFLFFFILLNISLHMYFIRSLKIPFDNKSISFFFSTFASLFCMT